MMTFKHRLVTCLCLVFATLAPLTSGWTEPARPMSIMVYPLAIHADTSMDYLQTGIGDLMVAKLTENNISSVRASSVIPREEAAKQALDADMSALIMGSLTFLGNSFGITLSLIDSQNGHNIIAYSQIEGDKDKLLSHVDTFINQVIAGKQPHTPPPTESVSMLPPPKAESSVLSETIIRSEDIKTEIVALAVGNTDEDNKQDLILADIHNIFIMNLDKGALVRTGQIKGESYLNIIHVDTYDANGNGRDEVIVTAVHARNSTPLSYAYEWDGNQYVLISKSMDWFFRKGPCPSSGETALIGQQQHFSDGGFAKEISIMAWDEITRTYIPQTPCPATFDRTSIYSYGTGDLMNKGDILTIVYTNGDYLSVLNAIQEDLWTSSERYGGSMLYLDKKKQTSPSSRLYLPVRIETGDFDQDGQTDVVTLQNKNANARMFSNLKKFVEGQVVCLSWKSLDFKPQWTSPKVSGYIPDFTLSDLDADGRYDLIYCVVPKKSSFFNKTTSYIVLQSFK